LDDYTGVDALDMDSRTATSTILSASCARSSMGVPSQVEANTIWTLAGSL